VLASDPVQTIVDPQDAAISVGLNYVSDDQPGITRHRAGKGFAYRDRGGALLREGGTLARIKSLAIPPAWTSVWICPSANGHIQATGRDARGRKQYRYHPRFREIREGAKFEHVVAFGCALPRLRQKVQCDLALRGMPRNKILAAVVHLLDTTLIRIGNEAYAKDNNSYGLTTLKSRHVVVSGAEIRFRFTGKSGRLWSLRINDRRIARIIKVCQELPGQALLQYVDADGGCQGISSTDVNDYLRELSGHDFTAKDFRTWAGTVLASMALQELHGFDSQAMAKANLRTAIERVAARLGNTPTICRKCYVHPEILNAYLDGSLVQDIKLEAEAQLRSKLAGMFPEEAAILAMLMNRLKRPTKIKAIFAKAA